jgi:hypothetical protein
LQLYLRVQQLHRFILHQELLDIVFLLVGKVLIEPLSAGRLRPMGPCAYAGPHIVCICSLLQSHAFVQLLG